jgi:hypothetical protein
MGSDQCALVLGISGQAVESGRSFIPLGKSAAHGVVVIIALLALTLAR